MRLNKTDRQWILTCFGTAVGAGVLFLPIQAGLGGIWPMLILTTIIFPLTYIAHRGITRIVASCSNATDITGAVQQDMGRNVAFAVAVLYFLSIVTICVGYATGITNITQSFLQNQMGYGAVSRPLLTFGLLLALTAVIMFGEKTMLRVTSMMTFPLIFLLLGLSLYLIPNWNSASFHTDFEATEVAKNLLLTFPVLVFAMNFSPICSSLGSTYRRRYPHGDEAVQRTDAIIKWSALILLLFVMFFVFSIVLATTPAQLAAAKAGNIDVLTMLSLLTDQPVLKYLIPIIAFLAIASSYFGHFLGTREGLLGIITRLACWNDPARAAHLNHRKISVVVSAAMVLGLWLLATYNPPILTIIGALSAPVIAVYAYLMPVLLMRRVPRLIIYRSKLAGFVFVMSVICIIGDFASRFL